MKQNSSKAWRLIRKLNCEKRSEHQYTNITVDEIAHQVLINGKAKRLKGKQNNKITRDIQQQDNNYMEEPFNLDELTNAIKKMKSGKAAEPYRTAEKFRTHNPRMAGSSSSTMNVQNRCGYQRSGINPK